ncbi:MAG: tetratricopeptide repeat protein [Acidobacteria bacterium]|nr:MAG: tetratricopeptide repeat protein [Acidobacteriota bacterium]
MVLVSPDVRPPALAGEVVVFTGRMLSLSRKEARLLVARLGGSVSDEVTARVTMLVLGAGAPAPGERAGAEEEKSQKIRRVEAINAKDPGRIRVVTEDAFCALAGVPSPSELRQQWYALHQILAMYPRLREDHLRYLQKWHLIRPALQTNAETYFSFPDLTVIRQANAELEGGTPFRAVLRSLQASREGQLSLDFSLEAEPAKVIRLARQVTAPPRGGHAAWSAAEEYFAAGSALDDGDPDKQEEACRAYRRALELDPFLVPALINLANIHYAREHLVEAEALYQRALALEDDVFEAHFNLGNVYHDLGRLEEARASYAEALRLNPDYPEAHFYAAVTLEKLGLSPQARVHWRRYLELAPDGEWVELAREFGEGQ